MNYRSGIFQVVLIGLYAMCGPGIFNAQNGLGSAGTGNAQTAAAANGSLYAFFAVFGYFAGVFFNTFGPRLCFLFGGLTYAVYSLCVYFTTPDRVWLAAIGGAVVGMGAGIFWCAQSTLVMGYATQSEKAKYSSVAWAIFNIGGVFGGFLQMILNWSLVSEENGGNYSLGGQSASTAAYMTFIALMVLGAVSSFFTLCPPDKVVKSDGSLVIIEKSLGAKEEIKAAALGITDKFVLRMLVYFLFSNYFYTYEFNYLNSYMFNSRGQGMNSGLYWFCQIVSSLLFSYLVDSFGTRRGWSYKKRILAGFWFNAILLLISWVLALTIQYTTCNGRVDKTNIPPEDGIYWMDKNGTENKDIMLNTLAWFPEVNGKDGCEFLQGMRDKQLADWDGCIADPNCVPNMYLCVKDPYYGKCQMDISSGIAPVCGLGDSSKECIQLDLSYTSQSVLVVLCYVMMGFSDAVFQMYCYFLMGTMAGSDIKKNSKYAAAYKGIQSLGAAVAWGGDYASTFLYRTQSYINVAVAVISCVCVWFVIPMVAEEALINKQAEVDMVYKGAQIESDGKHASEEMYL